MPADGQDQGGAVMVVWLVYDIHEVDGPERIYICEEAARAWAESAVRIKGGAWNNPLGAEVARFQAASKNNYSVEGYEVVRREVLTDAG